MAITNFDNQQRKNQKTALYRTSLFMYPGHKEEDISKYIITQGRKSDYKTKLGTETLQAGQNTAKFKNHDDFFSYDKRIQVDNVMSKVFRWDSVGNNYTTWASNYYVFPTTKASGDRVYFLFKRKYYALNFLISTVGIGALSTYFTWKAYDKNSASFKAINVYDLDYDGSGNRLIFGGLAESATTNYFGRSEGTITWYASPNNMFVDANCEWGATTINGFTGYAICMEQNSGNTFSTIPNVNQIFFCPSVLFAKSPNKIIHKFKYKRSAYVKRWVGIIKEVSFDSGVDVSKVAEIYSNNLLAELLDFTLGEDISENKAQPYFQGQKYLIPTTKKNEGEYYNNVFYPFVYDFEIPDPDVNPYYTIISVYITDDSQKFITVTPNILDVTKGKLYFLLEPSSTGLYVNALNLGNDAAGEAIINHFSGIGQVRGVLKTFVAKSLEMLKLYYNLSTFSEIWAKIFNETKYNVTINGMTEINCTVYYKNKKALQAIGELLGINNGRMNFTLGDSDAEYGQFDLDVYDFDIFHTIYQT